ncbi:hypothetical protein KFE25_010962 [Diacronema lutheri]|uniref:Uncharacterized protein n=1 Tax=Diacronema lutheri TaxID=2081491 RepID=A0A8J5XAL3_DIALT|nr:hypothetical protein KFE25_010962 [Diacronema lutheri]
MALPFAVARPAGSAVTVGGVQHSLLLSAEQQIDVWNVHNLLRDVYHVVATLDPPSRAEPDASGWGASSRGSPKGGSGILRRARASIEQLTRGGSTSSMSASANSVSVHGCSGPVANPHLACLTTQLAVSAGQSASLGQQRGASGALVSMGRLSSRASVATSVGAGTCALNGSCGRASGALPRRTGRVAPVSQRCRAVVDIGVSASSASPWASAWLASVLSRRSAADAFEHRSEEPSHLESLGRAIIEHGGTLRQASVSGARELRVLAAEREGSAEHVLEPERIAALLELALRLAQSRQRRLEVVTLTVGGGLAGVGAAALMSVSLRSDLHAENVIARVGVFWLGRLAFAAFSIVVGGTIALLSLQPLASQRKRIHALVALFNVYVIVLCSFFLSELVNNMHTLATGTTVRYDPLALGVVIGHSYSSLVGFALVVATAVDHWRWRHELERVLGLVYRILWVGMSGQAFAELTLMVSLARVGYFAQPYGAALAVLAFLPVAVYLVGTGLTCAPSFRERMRAALMVRLGALGALEALAPFAGFGTDAIERGVSAMCAEALCDFQPVLLDERALRVLDDVWTRAAHDARGTCTPSAGAASPSVLLRAGGAATGHHLLQSAVDMARLERSDTQRADAYIVHAWADDPAGKLRVLRAYARAFAREHGRPPAVWVDALCVQARAASRAPRRLRALAGRPAAVAPMGVPAPSCAPTPSIGAGDERGHTPAASRSASGTARDGPSVADKALSLTLPPTADASMRSDDGGVVEAQTQQLEHVVLRVARSSRLLVLAGPSVFERLWCVVECYVWLATGGSVEQIALLPTTNDAADDANLLAAADTFHVLFCDAAVEVHKRRLSLVVQIATVMRINSIMRSLLDPLHAALDTAAWARQVAGTAGAELPA